MTQEQRKSLNEARQFARVAYDGRMVYRYASDDEGIAQVNEVSRGGMRIAMGRYLRPGTRVLLEADGVKVNGQPAELKGQIVWCTPGYGHSFTAGVRVIFDEPDAVTAMSALVNHALHSSGIIQELKDRHVAHAAVASLWRVRPMGKRNRRYGARFAAGNA